MNKHLELTGNLGSDPEMRYTPDGKLIVVLRLAVTDRPRSGLAYGRVTWHRCIAHGPFAELASRLKKGAGINMEGESVERSWIRHGQRQSVTEIHVTTLQVQADSPAAGNTENIMGRPHSPLESARAAGLFRDDAPESATK
jgi:single-strand DNA-binding protein